MTKPLLNKPLFIIGMPRSGTTVLFEALSRHPALGWPSNYSRMLPAWPVANLARRLLDNRLIRAHGRKKQYGQVALFNRLLPQPDEAYGFWDHWSGMPFSTSALPVSEIDPATCKRLQNAAAALLRWQGRPRLAAKLTGPARIQFLNAVFPNAVFVHVIRDGRAVVHSLLKVGFWAEQGGLERPFWDDLLLPADIAIWRQSGNDAGILAALQWKRMIESARAEATVLGDERYTECTYENLVAEPHSLIGQVLEKAGLQTSDAVYDSIDQGPRLKNMNDKYRQDFDIGYIESLSAVMQPVLGTGGYR